MAKIRIEGEIKGYIRANPPFEVHPGLRVCFFIFIFERCEYGHELEVFSFLHLPLNHNLHFLSKQTRNGFWYRRPDNDLSFAGNSPAKHNSPNLILFIRESNTFERNSHLHSVAFFIDLSVRIENRIPTLVHIIVSAFFNSHQIHLNTSGIDEKGKSPTLLVKCVYKDSDPIIINDIIAIGYGRSYLLRVRIITTKCKIKTFLIITDISDRFFSGRSFFFRSKLEKIFDLQCFFFPEWIFNNSINLRRTRNSWNLQNLWGRS